MPVRMNDSTARPVMMDRYTPMTVAGARTSDGQASSEAPGGLRSIGMPVRASVKASVPPSLSLFISLYHTCGTCLGVQARC